MKRMLNVRTKYKRSAWYDGMRLDPTKDNVLSQRNDDLHASTRSKMVKTSPSNIGPSTQLLKPGACVL